MHERGRNSAASAAAASSLFAARIEMPVVLRGGMLDDRPAMVPVGAADAAVLAGAARLPRRLGTVGWVAATVICTLSVYAVRDTMFAPLAKSDAPSSAWETKHPKGVTAPALIATAATAHPDLDADEDSAHGGDTGTTVADAAQADQIGPVNATGTAHDPASGAAADSQPANSSSGPANAEAPTSTSSVSTSSTPSTSTPDTLGGHGSNSGGGKGGSGSGSSNP